MYKEKFRWIKQAVVLLSLPVVVAASVMTATPAQAASKPLGAAAATAVQTDQITLAVQQEVAAQLATDEAAATTGGDRIIPAAIAGALTICAAGAVASIGWGTLDRLIREGNLGRARDLLADAIIGCVTPIVGTVAWRACRLFSPCKNAVDRALNAAIDRIIREIRD